MVDVKCEICGDGMLPAYHHMTQNEKTPFFCCPSCGLRWAPELDVIRTFSSKLDEKSRRDALCGVREQEFEQVNRLLARFVQKGSRGLEVGCAYGWYLESVGDKYQMEGIEPEASVAEQARRNGHKVHIGFFPDGMPVHAMGYDFIVFNNVWEHINHSSQLIEGSLRYLKKNGIMIITIPLSSGGLYRLSEILESVGRAKELTRLWQLHFHSPHIYYFNKKNICSLMSHYNCHLLACEDVRNNIDPSRMKERFEMDSDETHGAFKAAVFRAVYPLLRRLPADKAVFVFQYRK